MDKYKKISFTMAEILISLTIIGVIAAITLPSLRANINESAWATQRKALYSRMSQAISLMPNLNGFGEFIEADPEHNIEGKDTVTMSFLTNGLSKVLEMRNICDNAHLKDCGLPDKIKAVNGTIYSTKPDGNNPLTTLTQLNIKFHGTWQFSGTTYSYTGGNIKDFAAAGFETKNGESVIAFYNPYCVDFEQAKVLTTSDYYAGFYVQAQRCMCANFLYDLNGKKGPNQVGKDIGFITALYPTDSEVVASIVYKNNILSATYKTNDGVYQASQKCKQLGDYRLPSNEELMALFYNQDLNYKNVSGNTHFWSNKQIKVNSEDFAYIMKHHTGQLLTYPVNYTKNALCVKR